MISSLNESMAAVPAGRWAVGVSGGADSVALLLLLRERLDLQLHLVHLDHETRAGASADDARFVAALAVRLGLPFTSEIRSQVERDAGGDPALNPSARYRAARLALFRRIVREHALDGVILAHHADDQAETILQRLLRGSGAAGLAGMEPRTSVGGLTILRPLLGVQRDTLRAVLAERGQAWCEDESNRSDVYLRGRLRRMLTERPELHAALLELGESCRRVRNWVRAQTPGVTDTLRVSELMERPRPIQREWARRWLIAAGVPEGRLDPGVIDQLLSMAGDAATPPRQHFPGKVLVRRARGVLSVQG